MPKNVIAPNPEEPAKLVARLAKWDYEKAVERVTPKVFRWSGLTADLAREFYFARKYLNNQTGQRKDPDAPDYIRHTWGDFCKAVGISQQAANSYLRRFVPAELSENGEDKLYTLEEWKALAPPEAPLTTREEERLIARFMNTGERPEGWTKGLERIAADRKETQRAKEVMELWYGKLHFDAKRDYFADLSTVMGKNKRFHLKEREQIDAQNLMFRAIHDYFSVFKKLPDLMAVAANLVDRVHFVYNYFAELLMDTEEAAGE